MTWARRVRVAAGLILLLSFALQGPWRSALMIVGAIRSGTPADDPVVQAEARFKRVRPMLPTPGVVGFRTVGPLRIGRNHEVEGDDRSITRYVIAQYILAPTILDLDLGRVHPRVVRDDLDPVQVQMRAGEDR